MSEDGAERTYQVSPEELRELEDFKKERERLRHLIGGIGGVAHSKRDTWVNYVFLAVVLLLLAHDLFQLEILPGSMSLEIGVFLVSFKIIYMIHQSAQVNHFEFWVLNSIEFRLNSLEDDIEKLSSRL